MIPAGLSTQMHEDRMKVASVIIARGYLNTLQAYGTKLVDYVTSAHRQACQILVDNYHTGPKVVLQDESHFSERRCRLYS